MKETFQFFNSSNLYFIENVFYYTKNSLNEYNLNDYKIDKNAKKYVKKIID